MLDAGDFVPRVCLRATLVAPLAAAGAAADVETAQKNDESHIAAVPAANRAGSHAHASVCSPAGRPTDRYLWLSLRIARCLHRLHFASGHKVLCHKKGPEHSVTLDLFGTCLVIKFYRSAPKDFL
jgi:hypothetical protein